MARAEVAATTLRAEVGDLPLENVVAGRGAQIVRTQGPPELSGMILHRDGAAAIGVNLTHSDARQQFTLAHELGHLVLHRGRRELVCSDDRAAMRTSTALPTLREESEANRFAATLLIPEALVRDAAAETATAGQLAAHLAESLGLSVTVVAAQLMALGYVTDL